MNLAFTHSIINRCTLLYRWWQSALIMQTHKWQHVFVLYVKEYHVVTTGRMLRTKYILNADFAWYTMPGNRGTYCFCSVSAAAAVSAAADLSILFNFPGKLLKLISSNLTSLTYGCWHFFMQPSRRPWVKATKLPKRHAIYLSSR